MTHPHRLYPLRLAACHALWVLALLALTPAARAQDEATTNIVQAPVTEQPAPAPATGEQPVTEPSVTPTNAIPVAPTVITNHVPVIPPPKQPYVPGGSTIRSAFSGKFVVPGRTLSLPAPEGAPAVPEADAWNRVITFAMNMTDGNSDTLRYGLGLEAARTRTKDTTRVRARSAYGESDGQKDAENAAAMIRYDRGLGDRWYAVGNVDGMTDAIADIDYRVFGILSPGIHLIKRKQMIGKLEAGAGYLTEKKAGDREGFAAGRAAAILERLFNANVLGWASVEYLPKLADPHVYYLNAEAGFISMLTRDLYLSVTAEDRYDSAPAFDKQHNDLLFTTALNLKF